MRLLPLSLSLVLLTLSATSHVSATTSLDSRYGVAARRDLFDGVKARGFEVRRRSLRQHKALISGRSDPSAAEGHFDAPIARQVDEDTGDEDGAASRSTSTVIPTDIVRVEDTGDEDDDPTGSSTASSTRERSTTSSRRQSTQTISPTRSLTSSPSLTPASATLDVSNDSNAEEESSTSRANASSSRSADRASASSASLASRASASAASASAASEALASSRSLASASSAAEASAAESISSVSAASASAASEASAASASSVASEASAASRASLLAASSTSAAVAAAASRSVQDALAASASSASVTAVLVTSSHAGGTTVITSYSTLSASGVVTSSKVAAAGSSRSGLSKGAIIAIAVSLGTIGLIAIIFTIIRKRQQALARTVRPMSFDPTPGYGAMGSDAHSTHRGVTRTSQESWLGGRPMSGISERDADAFPQMVEQKNANGRAVSGDYYYNNGAGGRGLVSMPAAAYGATASSEGHNFKTQYDSRYGYEPAQQALNSGAAAPAAYYDGSAQAAYGSNAVRGDDLAHHPQSVGSTTSPYANLQRGASSSSGGHTSRSYNDAPSYGIAYGSGAAATAEPHDAGDDPFRYPSEASRNTRLGSERWSG